MATTPLHHVLFGQGGDLLRRPVLIIKYPPIPLLPHVPPNVKHTPLKRMRSCFGVLLAVCSHHSAIESFLLWELQSEIFPR
jgi:hypothetical protein